MFYFMKLISLLIHNPALSLKYRLIYFAIERGDCFQERFVSW